jgi:hypothetical protein
LGGLIYVPDRERGAARQRVLQRRQGRAGPNPQSNDVT